MTDEEILRGCAATWCDSSRMALGLVPLGLGERHLVRWRPHWTFHEEPPERGTRQHKGACRMTDTSTDALRSALSRAEPIEISRTYQNMSIAKDLGDVSTLLTPVDVARRSLGAIWQVGRTRYGVAENADRAGPELAYGITAASVRYPDMCVACLAPATRGIVFESQGAMLPGGSGRSGAPVGILKQIAISVNRPYRREVVRPAVAGNYQRIWHAVPFCDAHDEKSRAVGFGETMLNRSWVAFHNQDYAAEFSALNAIQGQSFVRRLWPWLLAFALAVVFGFIAAAFS